MPRGGTPLGVGAPSLEASNQAQIDDLVQRNRTLEHTKQKLAEQLAQEATKSKGAIDDIREQWVLEKTEWRQGCDVLQSCHRVVQLQNVVHLERERLNVLKELDVTRKEKLLRLQRDFRITMFQAREAELEDRIRELEEQREEIIIDFEESVRRIKGKNAEYVAQMQAKNDQLAVSEQEREELEGTLAELREEHARRQGTEEELVTTLERTTLQRDSAIATRDDLKRTNEELKHTNFDLLRQLEKWQTLENKGGAEVESQRKKRIELEIQVKELQLQLEKATEEHEAALEKAKRKVEKFKNGFKEWKIAAEKHEEDGEDARRLLTKAENQITKLKDALEAERARVRPISPEKKRATSSPEIVADDDDEEIAPQPSPRPELPTTRPKPRPRQAQSKPPSKMRSMEPTNAEAGPSGTNKEEPSRPAKKRKAKPADSDIEEVLPVDKPKPKSKSKSRASPTVHESGHNSDIEQVHPKAKAKGKGKAVEEPDDVEIVVPEELAKKRGSKRKAATDDEGHSEVEVIAPEAKKGAGAKRAGSELRNTGTKVQRKVASRVRSASIQPKPPSRDEEAERDPDTEQELAVKKKRRKINIFPTNAEPTAFNFMPDVGGGLNIPTILSPVKESEGVPSRSNSGSVMGSIGSMLRNSFTRR